MAKKKAAPAKKASKKTKSKKAPPAVTKAATPFVTTEGAACPGCGKAASLADPGHTPTTYRCEQTGATYYLPA